MRKITISNPDEFLDFSFVVRGNFIRCTAIDIKEDYYEWRWEGIGGWNYPALFTRLLRTPTATEPHLWKMDCWRASSPHLPLEFVGEEELASGDIRSKGIVEKRFCGLLDMACYK